jgi:uncharacterized membrane protein
MSDAQAPTPPYLSLTPDATTRWTQACALFCVGALIVLGLAWELYLAPTGQKTWAIKVLPLLFPLAGLLRRRLYTYRWLSLLVWLYFTEGVVRATTEPGLSAALAGLQVLLCLLLFGACATHVRWRLARARRHTQVPPDAGKAP